jgi:hypothetical protein
MDLLKEGRKKRDDLEHHSEKRAPAPTQVRERNYTSFYIFWVFNHLNALFNKKN